MTIKEVSHEYNISQDTLRYYERVGMIPKVHRTSGGIRDYKAEDLGWVELSICMRAAGLPVEVMIEYVRLCKQGDKTIKARHDLLCEQRKVLCEQKKQIKNTIKRLDYKISRYKIAVETGNLIWDKKEE